MNKHALLTIGEAETPGDGHTRLCQPTSAVAAADGTVFVADGYCNNRIAVFDSAGRYMGQFGAQGKQFGV